MSLFELVAIVLVAALFAVVVVLIVQALRRRRNRKKQREAADKLSSQSDSEMTFDPTGRTAAHNVTSDDVKVGWFIGHPERGKLQVVGIMNLDEEGFRWREFFLETAAGNRQWMSAEFDESASAWEYVMWTEVGLGDYEKTGKKSVDHGGLGFVLDEKGTALYTTVGRTNVGRSSGSVDYFDYVSSAKPDLRFSIEKFNTGEQEASVGEVLDAAFVTFEPGVVTP